MFLETGLLKHWLFPENIKCCAYDFYRKYIGKTFHWLCTHFMIPAEKITGPSIA